MEVDKGGRGKKAPYFTTHVRVPLVLKADIEAYILEFKRRVENGEIVVCGNAIARQNKMLMFEMDWLTVQEALIDFICERGLEEKMHLRDNTNLRRFVELVDRKIKESRL
jgi:hypothetical protein